MATICVFCGSSSGKRPEFAAAAGEVGRRLAEAGHTLVYGGGRVGLMGVVADACLDAGGAVTGVITEQLQTLEVGHTDLTELHVTASMHERKATMAALADGVIVLPGGFGTLDEMFEILTWNQLGLVASPVVLLDVDGYFDSLFGFIDEVVRSGFSSPEHGALAQRAANASQAVALAAAGPQQGYSPKWVG